MNIVKSLGIDKLIARRAEIEAAAKHKAEADTVAAMSDAMLAYAERQDADNEKKLERAYQALSGLVFAKAVNSGSACKAYPLDEVLADGRKVREVCADMLAVVDRVLDIREDIGRSKSVIETGTSRIEEMRQRYIVGIEEEIARERESLAAAEKNLAAAEREYAALKNRYGVK